MLASANLDLLDKVRYLNGWADEQAAIRLCDRIEPYRLRYNFRMSDPAAALGRSQLRKLPSFIARRRELAGRYAARLSSVPGVQVPSAEHGSVFHRFLPAVRHNTVVERIQRYAEFGIEAGRGVYPALHRSLVGSAGAYPGAEKAMATLVSIPLYPRLDDNQVEAHSPRQRRSVGRTAGGGAMRAIAIIQARCGSTRLPGKVLKPLAAHNVLYYVVRRCQLCRSLADLIVATTVEAADDAIEGYCRTLGVSVYRGSRDDVLLRYVEAADRAHADPIVRITSDCPLIDPAIIDCVIQEYSHAAADYAFIRGYPRGVGDAEVMTLAALRRARVETSPSDAGYREHVMTYLTDHPEKFRLRIAEAAAEARNPAVRLCIDQAEDLAVVRAICEHFAPRIDFGIGEIMNFLAANPGIAALNHSVKQKP